MCTEDTRHNTPTGSINWHRAQPAQSQPSSFSPTKHSEWKPSQVGIAYYIWSHWVILYLHSRHLKCLGSTSRVDLIAHYPPYRTIFYEQIATLLEAFQRGCIKDQRVPEQNVILSLCLPVRDDPTRYFVLWDRGGRGCLLCVVSALRGYFVLRTA